MQAFERRVLTFTPSNAATFQVEFGNIGSHYYTWRYVTNIGGGSWHRCDANPDARTQ